jgi:hypothetical protein
MTTTLEIKSELLKQNNGVGNPLSTEDITHITAMFELISVMTDSQKMRLFGAMRQITDASLVIDTIYKELAKEDHKRYVNADCAGAFADECVNFNMDVDWKTFRRHYLFFGHHIKYHLDELIYLYQRAVNYIPSLKALWFN